LSCGRAIALETGSAERARQHACLCSCRWEAQSFERQIGRKSLKQIEANPRNVRKSTGSKTSAAVSVIISG